MKTFHLRGIEDMIGPDVRVGDDQTRISLLIFFHNHCIEQPSSWHPCIDYDYCKWRTYLSIWRRLSDMRTCTSNLRGGITWVQRDLSYRRLRFLWAELDLEFFLFVIDLIFCSIEAITKTFSTCKMKTRIGKTTKNIYGIYFCLYCLV